MPEVEIQIGGRIFQVACQDGEQHFLQSAASLLDNEAQSLADALGRVPETRMLLMAGLMLADKNAGLEEELRAAEARVAELEAGTGAPASKPDQIEVQVEVPVIPDAVMSAFSKIADRAEGVASQAEDAAAG